MRRCRRQPHYIFATTPSRRTVEPVIVAGSGGRSRRNTSWERLREQLYYCCCWRLAPSTETRRNAQEESNENNRSGPAQLFRRTGQHANLFVHSLVVIPCNMIGCELCIPRFIDENNKPTGSTTAQFPPLPETRGPTQQTITVMDATTANNHRAGDPARILQRAAAADAAVPKAASTTGVAERLYRLRTTDTISTLDQARARRIRERV